FRLDTRLVAPRGQTILSAEREMRQGKPRACGGKSGIGLACARVVRLSPIKVFQLWLTETLWPTEIAGRRVYLRSSPAQVEVVCIRVWCLKVHQSRAFAAGHVEPE